MGDEVESTNSLFFFHFSLLQIILVMLGDNIQFGIENPIFCVKIMKNEKS